MKYKDLTACINLVSVLYSYAFQLRDDILEIEQTIYDFRNVLLEFYEKQPEEDDYFLVLIKNIKTSLEKMNQIFIGNEFKFKHWNKEDQINLFEMDFHLKQQKEQIEKEYLRYHYLIESFEIDHPEAREFFKKSFGDKKFVSIDDFFVAFQNETSEIKPNTLEVMKKYIDYSNDGLVGIFKFYKFLNYFGNMKKLVENIQLLIDKGIHINNFSSLRATKELKYAKKGTYLIRFSKSHSNCFAISFKNDKKQIKHILVSCYKSGLKLKHSDKIFANLYEFLMCNCKILRQEQCDKGCQELAKKEDNKIVEVHNKGGEVEHHPKMCANCKRAYTDSV